MEGLLEKKKPADARRKFANARVKQVYLIQPGDYDELTPGENVILYDEVDGSIAGVVIWDFVRGGSVPNTLGHGLIEWINETVYNLGRLGRCVRVSQPPFIMSSRKHDYLVSQILKPVPIFYINVEHS